jgi:hypothetical protein
MILLNSFIGLIVSGYDIFNWLFNDAIIFINMTLLVYLTISNIKEGFKFGLSFVFIPLFILQFIFGVFLENSFIDNWFLIAISISVFCQFGLLFIARSLSKYA